MLLDDLPGMLAVMKVYVDRGAREDTADGVMCVAATVFKPVPYKRFVRHWNRMLAEWKAPAFHATDFYPGAPGPFARASQDAKDRFQRDCREIPVLIGEHTEQIIATSFLRSEYDRAAPDQWKQKYGDNLHSLAVQMCMIAIGHWARGRRYFGGFSYVVESGDKSEGHVSTTVANMRADQNLGPHIQCESYTVVAKGHARGLEAADMVAWHWNKCYVDHLSKPESERRDVRKDFSELVRISEDKIHLYFPSGEKLRYFLSLDPSITGAGLH